MPWSGYEPCSGEQGESWCTALNSQVGIFPFAPPQSVCHLHTNTDALQELCPYTNLNITLYICTALSQPHPDPHIMTNIQKSMMGPGPQGCALRTANDGCRPPSPLWLLSPRISAHPTPKWHPQHRDLPLPITACGTARAVPPTPSSAGCESLPGPRSHRPRCLAAGCHQRCTECTIPTVPPSAAATTCEFFPFPASGKNQIGICHRRMKSVSSCPVQQAAPTSARTTLELVLHHLHSQYPQLGKSGKGRNACMLLFPLIGN